MDRKIFIKNLFALSITSIGGAAFISSCSKESEDELKKERGKNQVNCEKNLTAEEKKSREEYEYDEISIEEEEVCNNCTHFQISKEGKECGTCELVKGPINPLGHCNQWFKKVEMSS